MSGILGFGLPVIATPIMLFAMSLPKVIAVLFLPIVIANIQQMWLSRKHWKIVKVFWPLIFISTLFMLMLSTQIIVLNGHILATAIGIFILSHALLSIYPLTNFKTFDPSQQSLQKLILPAGMLSGILGGLTSMYSFPSLQLFLSMRVAKNDLTFLLGVFLSLGYVTIWLGIGSAGFPVDESLTLSMLMLVPTILGQQIGDRI